MPDREILRWKTIIDEKEPNRSVGLLHEIVHCYYRVGWPLGMRNEEIEAIIQRTAEEFYEKHAIAVDNLVERLHL